MEDGKINSEDINAHIIAEDYEDMLNAKKNFVWDPIKKRFIKGKLNEKGTLEKDKGNTKSK